MGKTLISFVGTGSIGQDEKAVRKYNKAVYTINGAAIGEDSFLASILFDHLKIDRLVLFGTNRSMWEEVYWRFCEKRGVQIDEAYYMLLAERLEDGSRKIDLEEINLSVVERAMGPGSVAKIIPYGMDGNEQLQIFEALQNILEDLDDYEEVYLDITHAFRSIPLLSLTAMSYLTDVGKKEIALKGIFYGMLDVMREFGGKAPIVDLSLIIRIQEWIKGAYAFEQFGKAYLISSLLEEKHQKETLQRFSDSLGMNHLHSIELGLKNFKDLSETIDDPVGKLLLPGALTDFTDRLSNARKKSVADFQLELSIWHYEKKNYASAYIVFVEAILTAICQKLYLDWLNQDNRDSAKKGIKAYPEWSELYYNSNPVRRNIAHALRERSQNLKGDIKVLPRMQKKMKELLAKERDY